MPFLTYLYVKTKVPQLIAQQRKFLKPFAQPIPPLYKFLTNNFIQKHIPRFERLINLSDSMHLIIMWAINKALLATCLLADLTEY